MALRRTLAVLLALLVVVETGGVARALGADATVHCCCGDHSGARHCGCKACPVSLRGQHPKPGGDRLSEARSCAPGADEPVLVMLAITPPASPDLGPPALLCAVEPQLATLISIPAHTERPPP